MNDIAMIFLSRGDELLMISDFFTKIKIEPVKNENYCMRDIYIEFQPIFLNNAKCHPFLLSI